MWRYEETQILTIYYSVDTYRHHTWPGLVPESYCMDIIWLIEGYEVILSEVIYYYDITNEVIDIFIENIENIDIFM